MHPGKALNMAYGGGSILTLDLATRLGWCVGEPANDPAFGYYDLPKTGDNVGQFLIHFQRWLSSRCSEWQPELIVFEAPILPRKTKLITVRKLNGLCNVVEMHCCV